jgi:hypothetical protein
MLGRLARYLRFLGYDTSYRADVEDADLVAEAAREGRVVLTRDRALVLERRVRPALLLTSDATTEQLRAVVDHFGLDWRSKRPARCTLCNEEIVPEPGGARWRCPVCERVYWEGSHVLRLRARIEDALR